jgi:aromatase
MTTREVEHEIAVNAPAPDVYRLIAEVENWPRIFPPTIHVAHLERGERAERIQIWATANGEPKTWTSRRTLDPEGLRIGFRQEVSTPPVAEMGGTWVIEPVDGEPSGQSRIRLLHDYRAIDPAGLKWIDEAVDRNSQSELAALKANVEQAVAAEADLLMSFDDTVQVNGSAEDVYDFLNEAQLWEKRLAHVSRVALTEDEPGLQILEMDTRTKDGSVHTTKSIRVCFPHERIVYKQIGLPALLSLHTGSWLIQPAGNGVRVTAKHTVVINTANIAKILGDDAGVADAKAFVRTALSGNSTATLGYARKYAEGKK